MKEAITLALAICLLLAAPAPAGQMDGIRPQPVGIASIFAGLTIGSDGKAVCSGSVKTYEATERSHISIELFQCKGGKWNSLYSWSDLGTGPMMVSVSGNRYVTKGYDYQIITTVTVYDKNGNFMETQTCDSPIRSH